MTDPVALHETILRNTKLYWHIHRIRWKFGWLLILSILSFVFLAALSYAQQGEVDLLTEGELLLGAGAVSGGVLVIFILFFLVTGSRVRRKTRRAAKAWMEFVHANQELQPTRDLSATGVERLLDAVPVSPQPGFVFEEATPEGFSGECRPYQGSTPITVRSEHANVQTRRLAAAVCNELLSLKLDGALIGRSVGSDTKLTLYYLYPYGTELLCCAEVTIVRLGSTITLNVQVGRMTRFEKWESPRGTLPGDELLLARMLTASHFVPNFIYSMARPYRLTRSPFQWLVLVPFEIVFRSPFMLYGWLVGLAVDMTRRGLDPALGHLTTFRAATQVRGSLPTVVGRDKLIEMLGIQHEILVRVFEAKKALDLGPGMAEGAMPSVGARPSIN